MRFFLIFLVAAFIQSAFLPLNICLILIVCRNLLVDSRANLSLAFGGGLFLSFLTSLNLGFYALLFLVVAKLVQVFRASPLFSNIVTSLIFGAIIIVLFAQFERIFLGINKNLVINVVEIIALVPVYMLYSFWEERFIAPAKKSLVLKKTLR